MMLGSGRARQPACSSAAQRSRSLGVVIARVPAAGRQGRPNSTSRPCTRGPLLNTRPGCGDVHALACWPRRPAAAQVLSLARCAVAQHGEHGGARGGRQWAPAGEHPRAAHQDHVLPGQHAGALAVRLSPPLASLPALLLWQRAVLGGALVQHSPRTQSTAANLTGALRCTCAPHSTDNTADRAADVRRMHSPCPRAQYEGCSLPTAHRENLELPSTPDGGQVAEPLAAHAHGRGPAPGHAILPLCQLPHGALGQRGRGARLLPRGAAHPGGPLPHPRPHARLEPWTTHGGWPPAPGCPLVCLSAGPALAPSQLACAHSLQVAEVVLGVRRAPTVSAARRGPCCPRCTAHLGPSPVPGAGRPRRAGQNPAPACQCRRQRPGASPWQGATATQTLPWACTGRRGPPGRPSGAAPRPATACAGPCTARVPQ